MKTKNKEIVQTQIYIIIDGKEHKLEKTENRETKVQSVKLTDKGADLIAKLFVNYIK